MAEVVTRLASDAVKTTRDECAVIALDGVSREYTGRTGVVRALDSASFSIVAGEWVAVTGPSGSGKSTLVNLLGCLDRPTCGTLKIDGVDVAGMSAKELDRFRADKIGFVFQQFHLIPYLTAVENVMLAQYFPLYDGRRGGGGGAGKSRHGGARGASAERALGRGAAAGVHCAGADQSSADPVSR